MKKQSLSVMMHSLKKRIISLVLVFATLVCMIPNFAIKTEAMTVDEIKNQVENTYESARSKAGVSNFNGYCGLLVGWELEVVGINTSYIGANGNGQYDKYKNMQQTSGGYNITAYPASSYNLAGALNQITNNGTTDAYNILVGFETGEGSDGALYGHAVYVHGIINGTIYFCESFNARVGGTYYTEGSVISCSISTFASYYNAWATLDGVIHFQNESAATYTINFNANGGTGAPGSITKQHGVDITVPSDVPELFGHTFLTWQGMDSNGYYVQVRPGGTETINQDITYKALWLDAQSIPLEEIDYYQTYACSNTVDFPYQAHYYYVQTLYNDMSFRFIGTGTTDSCIYIYDENGTLLASDDDSGDNNQFLLDYTFPVNNKYYIKICLYGSNTGDFEMEVQRLCDVKYNANGGTGAPSNYAIEFGAPVFIPDTIPTRFGYTFKGWSTSSSATSAIYYPGDVADIYDPTTFYAVWEEAGYCAEGSSGDCTITSIIDFSGQYCYFTFSPCESGYYDFTSYSDKDTVIEIYDDAGNLLVSDDDSGEEFNFYLHYYFEARTLDNPNVYYIKTRLFGDDTGSFDTEVIRRTAYINIPPHDEVVYAGNTAVFHVDAWGTGLTYQWYYLVPGETDLRRCEDNGATSSTLYVQAMANKNGYQYFCGIFDDLGSFCGSNAVTLIVRGEQWIEENGVWYYYVNSVAQTGWQKISGKWYYLDSTGAMQTGWEEIDGNWYYFASGGAMQTGWITVNGNTFYLTSTGAMATGWTKIGDNWYLFGSGGGKLTGWQKISGKWYYMDSEGVMQTGWEQIGGKWYYFAAGGAMQTGWQKIGTNWYYFASGGAMQTGWQKIGTNWYYFAAGGAMQTGWQKIGGNWYYLQAGGAMATGTHTIGGRVYTFNKSGVWVA